MKYPGETAIVSLTPLVLAAYFISPRFITHVLSAN
jgi:hypothetical protein